MSVINFIGKLDINIKIPGEIYVKDVLVGDNVSLTYSGDRLKLIFTPILHDGTRLDQIISVSQITYQKGKLGLIGLETTTQTNYMVNYSVIGKRLTISINGKTNTSTVKSISEAIGAIIKVITTAHRSITSINNIR